MDGLGVDEVVEEHILGFLGVVLPETIWVLYNIPRTAEIYFITRLNKSRFDREARHYTYTYVDFVSGVDND